MNPWVLVPCKADVPYFPLLSGLDGHVDGAALENPVGIVVVVDFVELPQIDMVALQPAQAVVKMLLGGLAIPPAILRHQEHPITPSDKRVAHQFLAAAIVIIPRT